jgi:hypothetical protein
MLQHIPALATLLNHNPLVHHYLASWPTRFLPKQWSPSYRASFSRSAFSPSLTLHAVLLALLLASAARWPEENSRAAEAGSAAVLLEPVSNLLAATWPKAVGKLRFANLPGWVRGTHGPFGHHAYKLCELATVAVLTATLPAVFSATRAAANGRHGSDSWGGAGSVDQSATGKNHPVLPLSLFALRLTFSRSISG